MTDGLVFNVQRYSVQDGPGIRTTVFLKGCPLDCAWCHNPEGIPHRRQTLTVETRCIRCGECIRVCPHADASGITTPAPAQQCDLCGACVQACPTGARLVMGSRVSVNELLASVTRDRIFYEESGGGVTFSGGEPLSQPGFLRECLAACRKQGIHTAVDTCGYAPLNDLLDIASVTDLFLYDLKIIDEAAHLKFTGKPNRLILDNLRALSVVHNAIWVRVPLIPGVNDSKHQLQALATFASSIPNVRQVNVLPFHANGKAKTIRLGQSPRLPASTPPNAESIQQALTIFRQAGLPTAG